MRPKSIIELTENLKSLYIKTAKKLKGSDKRQFMAEIVKGLGIGGQTLVERELGWNRRTIRKGMQELESGQPIIDGFERSGRKGVETKLPNLLKDMKSLVEPQSQTDPSFKSTRLYTRVTASVVRRQLIVQYGYTDEELPTSETIRRKLNDLGYTLKRVLKTKPIKKIPETEAIFEQVEQINTEADHDPHTLRISIDAKVAVKVGEFDRGGTTRMPTVSLDHDFPTETTLTPYGIFIPEYNELFLFFVASKLTADCIVDLLESWWQTVKHRFTHIQKLVINQDNGPENHSRRTQFMKRIVDFSTSSQLNLQLAYYPPYHSKYNPIERCFGWLEQHWNGSLLDTVETVLNFAQTLTFKGKNPVVNLVDKVYSTGVKLTTLAMAELETQIHRLPNLKKWFVEIFTKPV
ncbi:Rhodopirellula transposase family protein (plasmid) [Anabaena cylindrica PCC 7122]|uniref:Rhodopirellula transposase family protein n=1 Tax=Anabaena cylindrica (strain ATCC 27899 / PCC 7122) TaxID=272123 RepID=K9ZS51_ANACC|nr:Rhodopirellula transposase family protein [Anabaena cylindrica PCC 7122]BAY06688.1 transposase [Anabaena cylindrica PCC 7122]